MISPAMPPQGECGAVAPILLDRTLGGGDLLEVLAPGNTGYLPLAGFPGNTCLGVGRASRLWVTQRCRDAFLNGRDGL